MKIILQAFVVFGVLTAHAECSKEFTGPYKIAMMQRRADGIVFHVKPHSPSGNGSKSKDSDSKPTQKIEITAKASGLEYQILSTAFQSDTPVFVGNPTYCYQSGLDANGIITIPAESIATFHTYRVKELVR